MHHRALRSTLTAATLALCGLAPTAADQIARLTDIGPGTASGLAGLDAAVLDGVVYFVGRPDSEGNALYRWNGVDPPELIPDSQESNPDELIAFGGKLYFQGGPSDDREVWVYDPDGPTVEEALDVRIGGSGVPQRFAVAGSKLCFGAFSGTPGFELFCWDGVSTPDLFDLAPGGGSSFPRDLVAWGDRLVFTAKPQDDELVFVYDGVDTPQAVAAAPGQPFDYPCCYSVVGDDLTFQAEGADEQFQIWRYDGVAPPAPLSTTLEPWGYQGAFRGRVVVDGADPGAGVSTPELWRATTLGLARVDPGAVVVGGEGHVTVGGALYFFAYPTTNSNDGMLFKFCGAGPVAPAHALFASHEVEVESPRPLAFDGRVLFSARSAGFGQELWALSPSHLFCDDFEAGDASGW